MKKSQFKNKKEDFGLFMIFKILAETIFLFHKLISSVKQFSLYIYQLKFLNCDLSILIL